MWVQVWQLLVHLLCWWSSGQLSVSQCRQCRQCCGCAPLALPSIDCTRLLQCSSCSLLLMSSFFPVFWPNGPESSIHLFSVAILPASTANTLPPLEPVSLSVSVSIVGLNTLLSSRLSLLLYYCCCCCCCNTLLFIFDLIFALVFCFLDNPFCWWSSEITTVIFIPSSSSSSSSHYDFTGRSSSANSA